MVEELGGDLPLAARRIRSLLNGSKVSAIFTVVCILCKPWCWWLLRRRRWDGVSGSRERGENHIHHTCFIVIKSAGLPTLLLLGISVDPSRSGQQILFNTPP